MDRVKEVGQEAAFGGEAGRAREGREKQKQREREARWQRPAVPKLRRSQGDEGELD